MLICEISPLQTNWQTAIGEMDQKVCEGAKLLNALHHQRELREKRLKELTEEMSRMKTRQNPNPEQADSVKVQSDAPPTRFVSGYACPTGNLSVACRI